jgi:hypothetical protein
MQVLFWFNDKDVRIDPYALFSICLAIAWLFHCIAFSSVDALNTLVVFAFLLGFQSVWFLIAGAIAICIQYWNILPVGSNHFLMLFFLNVSILAAALVCFIRDKGIGKEKLYEHFSVVGRYLLLIMYFYGIYHKINQDFLNPDVSCASALWDAGTRHFGLAGETWGHYLAIYTTFVVEGLAIFFLFTPRWKYYGFLIGIPFHIFIGFTGYAFYMDFSTLCIALYTLFLPREYFGFLNEKVSALVAKTGLSVYVLLTLLVLSATLLSYISGKLLGFGFSERYMPAFGIYAIAFYLSFVFWAWKGVFDDVAKMFVPSSVMIGLIPVVFFLNAAGPYFGLKTESSIAMFSNLFTEGEKSNHYFHRDPPYLFDYQNRLVKIESTSHRFLRRYIGEEKFLVELEFERFLEKHRPEKVVYFIDGEQHVYTKAEDWPARYSWIEKKLMKFKPVSFAQPKVCTH